MKSACERKKRLDDEPSRRLLLLPLEGFQLYPSPAPSHYKVRVQPTRELEGTKTIKVSQKIVTKKKKEKKLNKAI